LVDDAESVGMPFDQPRQAQVDAGYLDEHKKDLHEARRPHRGAASGHLTQTGTHALLRLTGPFGGDDAAEAERRVGHRGAS